jgi:hypothetical protein
LENLISTTIDSIYQILQPGITYCPDDGFSERTGEQIMWAGENCHSNMLYLVGEFDIHNDRLDTGDHTLLLKNTKENDVQNGIIKPKIGQYRHIKQ